MVASLPLMFCETVVSVKENLDEKSEFLGEVSVKMHSHSKDSRAQPESQPTSKGESFPAIVNGFYLLTIVGKLSILHVCEEYWLHSWTARSAMSLDVVVVSIMIKANGINNNKFQFSLGHIPQLLPENRKRINGGQRYQSKDLMFFSVPITVESNLVVVSGHTFEPNLRWFHFNSSWFRIVSGCFADACRWFCIVSGDFR